MSKAAVLKKQLRNANITGVKALLEIKGKESTTVRQFNKTDDTKKRGRTLLRILERKGFLVKKWDGVEMKYFLHPVHSGE